VSQMDAVKVANRESAWLEEGTTGQAAENMHNR